MKKSIFELTKEEGQYIIRERPLPRGSRSVVFLYRPDFEVVWSFLPRMNRQDLRGFVEYTVTRAFPAPLSDVVYRYSVHKIGPQKLLCVAITKKGILDRQLRAIPSLPTVLPEDIFPSLLTRLVQKGEKGPVLLCWYTSAWSVFFYYDVRKETILSRVCLSLSECERFLSRYQGSRSLLIAEGSPPEAIVRAFQERRTPGEMLSFLGTPLFAAESPVLLPRSTRVQLYLFITLLSLCVGWWRRVEETEKEVRALSEMVNTYTARYAAVLEKHERLVRLQEQYTALKARVPPDVYGLIMEICEAVVGEVEVRRLVFQGGRVVIEGWGSHVVEFVEQLRSSLVWDEVVLSRLVPQGNGADFTIILLSRDQTGG